MKNFLFFIDSLSLWTGKAFSWLILVLTLGVSYEVFVRYVLSAPTTWAFDFSYITYGALFLMAGAYTLSRNGHVRADVIYRFLPPRTQASFDIVLYVIFFLPAIAAFMYSGYIYAEMSVRFREVSIFSPAGVPVFPLKTLIPVTGLLLLLQGIAEIIRCILCIREGAWPARLHDVEETESVIIHETQYKQERGEDDRDRKAAAGAQGDWSMTDPQVGMLMLFLFIFIIMLGFPIAFTLMAMGLGFGFYAYYVPGQEIFQNRIFILLVSKAFEVMSNDVLTAVPLFLFMGYVVERANILDRLFHSLQLSMKNIPGALAVATLVTCAMFATATGIVGAVVTLMGLLAFPAMLRAGYDVRTLGRRGLRRRLPGHPDPAEHPADRLCGHRRRIRGQALCGRLHSGIYPHRILHRLRDFAGRAQSVARSQVAERADRHTFHAGHVGVAHLVLPAG